MLSPALASLGRWALGGTAPFPLVHHRRGLASCHGFLPMESGDDDDDDDDDDEDD